MAAHWRWANATTTHGQDAKTILKGIIATTGKPLDGGVTERLVDGLPLHDVLDLAQQAFDKEIPGSGQLGKILAEARTTPAE